MFWKTASEESKRAQVEAGYELGMTAKQIGMNLGTTARAVLHFVNSRGVNPVRGPDWKSEAARKGAETRNRQKPVTRFEDLEDSDFHMFARRRA